MADDVYTIHVTGKQLEAVSKLFKTKGWQLQVDDKGSRYLNWKEVADEYVDLRIDSLKEGVHIPNVPKENNERTRYDSSEENGAGLGVDIPIPLKENKEETRCDPSEENGAGLAIDRSQKSFKDMKQTADKFQTLRSGIKPVEAPQIQDIKDESVEQRICTRKGTWRLSHWDPDFKGHIKSEINLQHSYVVEGNLLKVLTSLNTDHIHQVSKVPIRIVLLLDRSGSMLNKLGKGGRHSKITKVKHFAKQLITSLDGGDEAAVVTFGKEAEIFFPLTKITEESRPFLMEMLNKLDKGGMSQETNLSDGLRMALRAFYEAVKDPAGYLSRKNSIIIFSDGEINAGTVAPQSLVHEVRQNIRKMVPNLDDSQNQWVTISVITTGQEVSEQAYMLSKHCSSDAYYYIDSDAEDPEAELFIPVLLRKTAVAWNISLLIESFGDLPFVEENCTQDFRVRLRRSLSGKSTKAEKAYFLYDFPAGHSREIGVCFDLSQIENLESRAGDDALVQLRVEYSNIKGERVWQERVITVADVKKAKSAPGDSNAIDAVHKHDLRIVTTGIFHAAAEHVRKGDKLKSKNALVDGQKDIQALMEKFGSDAQIAESRPGPELTMYARSVVDNLSALIGCIESSTDAGSWNRIKAVSTAIARETPNVTEMVKDGDVLCPLPEVDNMENKGLTTAMEKLVAKQGKQKRVSFGALDRFLEETLT